LQERSVPVRLPCWSQPQQPIPSLFG
jgi:hypothetical protein